MQSAHTSVAVKLGTSRSSALGLLCQCLTSEQVTAPALAASIIFDPTCGSARHSTCRVSTRDPTCPASASRFVSVIRGTAARTRRPLGCRGRLKDPRQPRSVSSTRTFFLAENIRGAGLTGVDPYSVLTLRAAAHRTSLSPRLHPNLYPF